MTTLRLLADDLTGALDTAAQFVGLTGPMPVFWAAGHPAPVGSAAFDSGTREAAAATAAAAVSLMASLLAPAPGRIAFKKIDSLLRGHSGQELAACLVTLAPAHCIVAPAFPFQGRLTRGGLQYMHGTDGLRRVGEDIAATLVAEGLEVARARPGDGLPRGISIWDAETDADLARIANVGMAARGSVLWCGSSGLAGALAGDRRRVAPRLVGPILGLFGSDHPVTTAQLVAAENHLLRLPDGDHASAARLAARLREAGVALAAFDLPASISRAEAAATIMAEMDALTRRIEPPGTLVVAGGETLRALCVLLGAAHLEVHGQIVPGIPQSVLRGGRWDGVSVISKSGAFGTVGLLRQLVAGAPLQEELGA
jgi:uncharacterized protein YgbK (DUF1537 family)